MTQFIEFPPEPISDAIAWRTEVGIQSYRLERLTLRQLAEFIGCDRLEAIRTLEAHGLEVAKDEEWLEDELAGSDALLQLVERRERGR